MTAAEERWRDSIRYYELWREASLEEDDVVYRGLSYAHYQVDELPEALPYWISYMELLLTNGEELGRDDYSYLNGLYFQLEDFENALPLTKTMIVLFDEQTDWTNLSAVYASLDDEERRVRSMNVAYLKGMLDDEARFLNLGQSLGGIDIPSSGAKVLVDGVDQGFVEETEEILTTLAQMYLLATDYQAALGPPREVTGDGYDTYGYLHYVMRNYQEAADAFQMAIYKGNLSNRADTLLFLARALIELDDFEGAKDAATQSADAGGESERRSATDYITFIESTESRFNIIAERRQDAIDFYEPYPSLID